MTSPQTSAETPRSPTWGSPAAPSTPESAGRVPTLLQPPPRSTRPPRLSMTTPTRSTRYSGTSVRDTYTRAMPTRRRAPWSRRSRPWKGPKTRSRSRPGWGRSTRRCSSTSAPGSASSRRLMSTAQPTPSSTGCFRAWGSRRSSSISSISPPSSRRWTRRARRSSMRNDLESALTGRRFAEVAALAHRHDARRGRQHVRDALAGESRGARRRFGHPLDHQVSGRAWRCHRRRHCHHGRARRRAARDQQADRIGRRTVRVVVDVCAGSRRCRCG